MKTILLVAVLFAACNGCQRPPPFPNPPPEPWNDGGPAPSPVPVPTVPPAPTSDRFDLACGNMGRVGCADYDPETCVKALRAAFEANISPTTLNGATIDCLCVAPNKTALRACGFEKCP